MVGLAIGISLGVAMANIGVGIAIGIGIGIAFGLAFTRSKNAQETRSRADRDEVGGSSAAPAGSLNYLARVHVLRAVPG